MTPPIIRITQPVQSVDWKAYPTPQAIITSPPYWNKRKYPIADSELPSGEVGQLGCEKSPMDFVENLTAILCALPLAKDGIMWINIGDTYVDKSLALVPTRLALEMYSRGWYVRSMVIWHKRGFCLPENASDRCDNEYEPIIMLTKSAKYKFNKRAITVPAKPDTIKRSHKAHQRLKNKNKYGDSVRNSAQNISQNWAKRGKLPDDYQVPIKDVWHLSNRNNDSTHSAPMSPFVVERCLLLSTDADDYVLDPFAGTGTTMRVAAQHGRKSIGVELDSHFGEWVADIQMQNVLC